MRPARTLQRADRHPASRPASRRGPLGWLLGTLAGTGALWVLQFHVWMLWGRLTDLTISEPGVALRWLAAISLWGVAWRHARRGQSLLRGRHALVLWALAFLLHAGATPVQAHPLPLSAQPPAAVHLLWLVPLGLAGELDGVASRVAAGLRRRLRTGQLALLRLSPGEPRIPSTSGEAPDLGVPRAPPCPSAALATA